MNDSDELGSTGGVCRVSPDLDLSNPPVRTRMPCGVVGEQLVKAVPNVEAWNLADLTTAQALWRLIMKPTGLTRCLFL